MSSFKDLLARVSFLNEAKVSPYSGAHPSFAKITSKMKAGGLSSAPLDTIKFIREVLYYLDIIDDQELIMIKKAPGFTGKKIAMLNVLKAKQQEINAKSDEISERVSSTLDDFINGVGVNRGKEEKYAAQAASQEISKQMRQVKSGKEMDDALTDIISDETILVKTSVAGILAKIGSNIGEPGFEIDEEALSQVMSYAKKITSLSTLKTFIRQIASEPGYEKIADYLSAAVKAISLGSEDEEMEDKEMYEDEKIGPEEFYDPSGKGIGSEEYDEVMSLAAKKDEFEDEEFDPNKADIDKDGDLEGWERGIAKKRGFVEDEEAEVVTTGKYTIHYGPGGEVIRAHSSDRGADIDISLVNKYLKEGFPLSRACAAATSYPNDTFDGNEDEMMMCNYTSDYMTDQTRKDSFKSKADVSSISFKERYKPKTSYQLDELRRYGL
jgi:hypothetical protein